MDMNSEKINLFDFAKAVKNDSSLIKFIPEIKPSQWDFSGSKNFVNFIIENFEVPGKVDDVFVIAGTDGSGKGTQVKSIINKLEREEIPVVCYDFPRYERSSGKLVRRYLQGLLCKHANDIDAYTTSVFYALDRYAASMLMKEDLKQGNVVVCNRYVSANKGHQGGKINDDNERDYFLSYLNKLEYGFFGIPKERENIMLYMPSKLSQNSVDFKSFREYSAGRDLHEKDLDHINHAERSYLYVADKENWHIIDCLQEGIKIHECIGKKPEEYMLTVPEITEKIYTIIKTHFEVETEE